MIVNNIALLTEPHGPVGSLVVIVNVTFPFDKSFADGVYVAEADDGSSKVPSPLLVHVKDPDPPPIEPESVYDTPAQIVASSPAFAVAAGFIVNTIASNAKEQGPDGSSEVIVIVTEPVISSADDGV